MRFLLDTQIFIWCDSDPARLSSQARALCNDPQNVLVLSVASVWEMQIKVQLGKMKFNLPLKELIETQQQTNGLELLPISVSHVLALETLPSVHKDPFDRLLAAQAVVENFDFVTADPIFRQYPVRLLW